MGLYISADDIKPRVAGKVRFTDSDDDPNKVGPKLLMQLISEAESQVELDLSERYLVPFVTDAGLPFAKLPDHPTRRNLTNLCILQSAIRILETDFGDGTVVDAGKYVKSLRIRYKAIVAQLVEKRDQKNDTQQWRYPPLPSLKLAVHNALGDDGFAGAVLTTSMGVGGYPAEQIDQPGATFWDPFGGVR